MLEPFIIFQCWVVRVASLKVSRRQISLENFSYCLNSLVSFRFLLHVSNKWQNITFSLHSDDSYSDSDNEDINEHNLNQPDLDHFNSYVQWEKAILITGKPSSGKLHTILAFVRELIKKDVNILIASPTGFLSSVFRAKVSDHMTCDTVYAGFRIPVNSSEPPTTNWSLSRFDLVIINEVSMTCESIFNIILSTLQRILFRHVLVLCGDAAQQQPFEKNQNRLVPVTNALAKRQFLSTSYHS